MRRLVPCAVAALALSACTVGPDFIPPPVVASDSFGHEPRDVRSRTTDAEPDPQWWRCFRDPALASLEERLAAQNLDLKTAAERVAQAGAERAIVASQGLPHAEVQSMNYYERISKYGTASLASPSGEPLTFSFLQQGLNASWELDLFGKVRRAVEAQDATMLAAIENRRGVALMALAELAQSYMSLRGTQTQLAIAERNLRVAEDDIKLVESRFANGVATTLDLAQARGQKESIAETLPPLRARARRSSSMPSACCWASSPALWNKNCGRRSRPRRLRAWSASACRRRCCGVAPISARRRRAYTPPWRKSARRRLNFIPT